VSVTSIRFLFVQPLPSHVSGSPHSTRRKLLWLKPYFEIRIDPPQKNDTGLSMFLNAFTVLAPACPPVPLIVDSPHSGHTYPADFSYICPLPLLRQTEDSYVDELVGGAVKAGATVVVAEFPRCYIDVNRAEDDIDPAVLAYPWPEALKPSEKTLLGLGLVRRLCKSGVPIYDGPLSIVDVQQRIEQYYRPYHAALKQAIAQRAQNFGVCYLIDCHSMPDRGSGNRAALRPDFVLGDRNGTSCDLNFTRRVQNLLQNLGYTVTLNDPYKGVEIVRRYGQPQAAQHALQMEINRRLYMSEQTLEKHDGFPRLRQSLTRLFASLATELMRTLPDRLAAK
jgi:N-formylglutamate deformylase